MSLLLSFIPMLPVTTVSAATYTRGYMAGFASGKMAPVSKASRVHVAVIIMSMDKKGMFDGQ